MGRNEDERCTLDSVKRMAASDDVQPSSIVVLATHGMHHPDDMHMT